jgi:hypothetical protein
MEGSKPQTSKSHTVENAVKLVGEAFVPGASLLMDGKILAGGAHLIVGAWARAALGPVGLALVIANSYSQSATGKNLLKQFTKDEHKTEAKAEHNPEAKAEHK